MSVKIGLAGNPNCGKTTLFNALTGSNQYVGNWSGVTVEKKEGRLKAEEDAILVDLPGIYSLSPYTLEEVVARNFLLEEKPDAIINIIDGTNIERNLYLSTQIMELGIPVVMAVNMMDLVRKNKDVIHLEALGEKLGCKVVEISALRGEGIEEVAHLAVLAAKEKIGAKVVYQFSPEVEEAIRAVEEKIPEIDEDRKRFCAIKLIERDDKIGAFLKREVDVSAQIAHLEEVFDDDTESIITNERYNYITSVIGECVTKARGPHDMSTSDKIDSVVTNRFLALPIFAIVMFGVYFISVSTVGNYLTDWCNDVLFGSWIQPTVQHWLEQANVADWLISLVVEGIIGGIAAPVGFAPQMAIVFFFLTILEDCGYMARVAFIMDKVFRHFGLSGKSFIPFMISSGCGVPGIMGTRTIENEKDRRMTMITTTFIPCGAKLPVISLIAGVLSGVWWVGPTMYFIGIASVILSCIILKKTKYFSGEPAPFVMELPQYHMPSPKNVALHVWDRVWSFLKKAGTVLFACCVAMWFLASFGFENGSFGIVNTEHSLLASFASVIAFIFTPVGFGNWKLVASSLAGFVAKEGIVSTMGVLTGIGEEAAGLGAREAYATLFPTGVAAFSFLCFNLLDSPCLAAITTLAKEMQSKKGVVLTLLYQNIYSYVFCLILYQLGGLLLGQVAFSAATVVAAVLLVGFLYLLLRKNRYKTAEE